MLAPASFTRAATAAKNWGLRQGANGAGLAVRYPNLEVVFDFIGINAWLAQNDTKLFTLVVAEESSDADATLPHGALLSAAESVAARLGVGEMRRQVERIGVCGPVPGHGKQGDVQPAQV